METLSHELILVIVNHLGTEYIDKDIYRTQKVPLAYLLYATSKAFSWLAHYRYSSLCFDGEYNIIFETTTIDGTLDGPVLTWMNQSRMEFSGYSFYRDGNRIYDNIGDVMLASNDGLLEINNIWYEYQDICSMNNISSCCCEWCNGLQNVFAELTSKITKLMDEITYLLYIRSEQLTVLPSTYFNFAPITIRTPQTLIKSKIQPKI